MRSAVVCLVALVGCSGFIQKRAASAALDLIDKGKIASRREGDVEVARAALPGSIVQLEAFALAYPFRHEFRDLQTDAVCEYGIGFVFDDWDSAKLAGRADDAAALAERIVPLAERCIAQNLEVLGPKWKAARAAGGAALVERANAMTKAEDPPALWVASALAVEVAIAPLSHLGDAPAVLALLAKCSELAPARADAGAALLHAAVIAAAGSTDLADAEFAHVKTLAPELLLVDVLRARGVLVARGDRAGFVATLQKVVGADLEKWPEHRLANALARAKAQRYLGAIDALFPPSADQNSTTTGQ